MKFINLYKEKGKFYKVQGIDAYIINILLGYKIINGKCGFPDNALNKVTSILENEKISYQIIVDNNITRHKFTYNNYILYEERALINMEINDKIELLQTKIKSIPFEKLEKVLELLLKTFYENQ